jgi:hypothetical protein
VSYQAPIETVTVQASRLPPRWVLVVGWLAALYIVYRAANR